PAELPMLFQRILQNTIHDHFRRQKVRSTWTTLLSALGQKEEKDEDFDPLETLPARPDSNASIDPAGAHQQAETVALIEQALARLSAPRRAPELVLAGAGGGTLGGGRRFFADVRIWAGVLVVVGGILSIQYWQSVQHDRDIEETDAAILSSELPLEAYLD